jgi:hypothetical protein
MIMPELNGQLSQENYFIFTAADSAYFNAHAIPLINSVIANTEFGIHIHIYNPTPDQIRFCIAKPRVSVSYEYVNLSEFSTIAQQWLERTTFANIRQKQMFDKGQQFGLSFIQELITRTYYACARFVRLDQLLIEPTTCLAIDVDGVVRKPFSLILPNAAATDVFLYQKRSNEHLAGAMLFNENSKPFLQHYAKNIKKCIAKDDIYWFMDQLVLDQVISSYRKGLLPISYIDWDMHPNSAIWTAKGRRKDLAMFKVEQSKYMF